MKIFIIHCILIINIICSNYVLAQNLDTAFYIGKKNFSSQNYSIAKNQLFRIVFFDSTKKYSYEAYNILGDIETHNQNYTKAQLFYDYSYSLTQDTILKDAILIKKSILYLHQREFSLASATSEMINGKYDSSVIRIKIMTQAANYINSADFDHARQVILELANNKTDSMLIEKIFIQMDSRTKNLKTANLLSAILPGAGQAYLGDFKNGSNSFILVGSLTFIVINTAIIYNPLSAFLAVFPWWLRYYTGGIKKNHVIYNRSLAIKKEKIYSHLIQYYQTLH